MVMQPRLAATVMLLRNTAQQQGIEIFMVRRVVQSEFMPDIYVFPGGSASAVDKELEQSATLYVSLEPSAADPEGRTALGSGVRAAAIRELFEEGNVLLAYQQQQLLAIGAQDVPRFAEYRQQLNARGATLLDIVQAEQLVLATEQLAYFAHWITPEQLPRRFDTHFFLAAAPMEQEALYDQLETSEGLWIRPGEALKRFAEGTFPVAFPTYHQLRDLAPFATVQEALAATRTRYVPTYQPVWLEREGGPFVYLPEDPDFLWKL
jgi:8-oxo-dGTP pyrophosphatase MutT (NUDIX family)